MNSNDVYGILIKYAEDDENIRAVLTEGSRAFGTVDKYSDYDIVYVTVSSEPYFNNAIIPFLEEKFGEIAIMQNPNDGDPRRVYTHLIQFKSGVRIDLTFNSLEFLELESVSLESATGVLLDKDGRFANLPSPSDSDFHIKKPSYERFRRDCNEFWWCCPYVTKALARGQIIYALEFLTETIRKEYMRVLSYLAGANNNWERVNTGKHHTDIYKYLTQEQMHYYDVLINSYVQADRDKIKRALFALMESFNALAIEVAGMMGFEYNHLEMEKCRRFIQDTYK